MNRVKYLIILFVIMVFFGCAEQKNSLNSRLVYVSIPPQKFFVEKISGKVLEVAVMVAPGYSPATYDPAPVQIKKLSSASLYFKSGYLGFEKKWIKNFREINPEMVIKDTSTGVKLIRTGHKHGSEIHSNADPHIWLNVDEVKVQAENIYTALVKHYPEHKVLFKKNYMDFSTELKLLDQKIRSILKGSEETAVLVFHPAWSYFLRDYRIKQVAIEQDGKEPGALHFKNVILKAKEYNIKYILLQKQFDRETGRAIAEQIGGEVIQLDPLSEEWSENMIKIAETFRKIAGSYEKHK